MRILIDARFYGLENAGLGRYVMNLVDGVTRLDQKNHYTILLKSRYFNQIKSKDNIKPVLADISHYSLKEQIALPGLIKKCEPDLVHFPHFNVPIFYHGKYVVTIHDLLMHNQKGLEATTLPAPFYFTKRLAYHRIFKHAVIKAVKIIVPSQAVKREVAQYYKISPDKIAVTYEGVSKVTKKIKNPKDLFYKYDLKYPYFIYTGSAYPHKNLKRVISAIVRLNQHSRVEFAIVCSRSIFTERLERTIVKQGAEDYVKLLGYVPDDELAVLFEKSAGFVFASISEGFGLPGVEAISAGTVALVSDIAVFREIYQDKAIFFNPYRIDSIVESLKKVLSLNSSERANLVSYGQQFVKKYTWDKTARDTLEVYESAVK